MLREYSATDIERIKPQCMLAEETKGHARRDFERREDVRIGARAG